MIIQIDSTELDYDVLDDVFSYFRSATRRRVTYANIRNSINFKTFPLRIGEVNILPSETVPGEAMSVREILRRYAAGLPIEGKKIEFWEEDDIELEDILPNLEHLDLAEREEIIEQYKQSLEEQKEYIKTQKEMLALRQEESKQERQLKAESATNQQSQSKTITNDSQAKDVPSL